MKVVNPQGRVVVITERMAKYYLTKPGWQKFQPPEATQKLKPVHVGGGWYDYPDGTRKRGKP